MGSYYVDKIKDLVNDYPGVKIIVTNRDNNYWVISMKNHYICDNQPNIKRTDLIKMKNEWIDNILKQKNSMKQMAPQYDLEKFNSFLMIDIYNTKGNKWKPFCDFLNKPIRLPFRRVLPTCPERLRV